MITVIIPTLNAEKEISQLLKKLFEQKRQIDEIFIIDSSSKDNTLNICKAFPGVKTIVIERKDFNHGKTRDYALKQSKGDIVVFMTQDAVPANDDLIGNLVAPLEYDEVAVCTARQISKDDSRLSEKLIRNFNYPNNSRIKCKTDIPDLGIKTFFCSNVCAAYRRDVYFKLGGFECDLRTNEDMFYAAKAIENGYKVAYVADAIVYHSHNFSLKEQFTRNYIQSYEIERHKELLNNVVRTSEGIRLVTYVTKNLLKGGHFLSLIYFVIDSEVRYLGSKYGEMEYKKELKKTKK